MQDVPQVMKAPKIHPVNTFYFPVVHFQRVVSAPDGGLGLVAVGQRVVNVLPQRIPPPHSEARGSDYWKPSGAVEHL